MLTQYFNKSNLNIPNILSLYRLLSSPFVLYFAFKGNEPAFVILLVINLITDILDGFIARTFNLQTEFGARLDAYADIGMYIQAFIGIIIFKSKDFDPYIFSFSLFMTAFILPKIIAYIKFHRFPSLHLYSSKIGGYLQGFFFFALFTFGFSTIFYYVTITWGILSFIEQIIIVLIAPEMKSNVKGLYWLLNKQ